jgi:XTP/dITP diphosphohydrolase
MNTGARPRLLVATGNRGKLKEFRALLPRPLELLSLTDVGLESPPETGTTFAENARLKARAAARQSGLIALADDSGLEVDALGGAPGLHSARYAGEGGDDQANREKLLAALTGVPFAQRGARFRCVLVVATPDGQEVESEGVCEGSIAFSPSGEHGFGYDPLFVFPDGRTMAQLLPDEKNAKSHRARACQTALPSLLALFGLTEDAET